MSPVWEAQDNQQGSHRVPSLGGRDTQRTRSCSNGSTTRKAYERNDHIGVIRGGSGRGLILHASRYSET
jgi:hypothetical protein